MKLVLAVAWLAAFLVLAHLVTYVMTFSPSVDVVHVRRVTGTLAGGAVIGAVGLGVAYKRWPGAWVFGKRNGKK